MAQAKPTDQVVVFFQDWYAKLPSLPENWRKVIVSLTPWLSLIFGILGVLASLAALGIIGALSPFMVLGGGVGTATSSIATVVLSLLASALWIIAFPALRAQKASGWKLLFWSEMISIIGAVVSFALGGVLSSLIALYFIFQIKSYYK